MRSVALRILVPAIFVGSTLQAAPPIDMTRGPADEPAIALTFDAGSSSRGARDILDVLRTHGIRSTFFLTGEFIERNPDIVMTIVEDGHEVGNHTWSHPHLTTWSSRRKHATAPGVDQPGLLSELERTAAEFERLTGRRMASLWRAPYGEVNRTILG